MDSHTLSFVGLRLKAGVQLRGGGGGGHEGPYLFRFGKKRP